MRVTNSMMQNQMLLNINRNMTKMNKLLNQQSSGKRIIVPSDDPISASRALTLRSNVSETLQYQKNLEQANSWMEITEQSYTSTLGVFEKISELAINGNTGTLSIEDRKKIAKELSSLVEQLGVDMNGTYGGRYVFSGYRTDEEAVFTESDADASYKITQQFIGDDIREVEKYQKLGVDDEGKVVSSDIINLAYDDIKSGSLSIGVLDDDGNVASSITAIEKSINDADAYEPTANEVYYVKETGELVIGSNVKKTLKDSEISVTYDKEGFIKGDLNPKVYFDCEDINIASSDYGKKYTMAGHDNMEYEVGAGNRLNVNSLAKDVFTANIKGDLSRIANDILNMTKSTESSLKAKYEAEGYTGDALTAKIKEQLDKEEALMSAAATDAFNDLLGIAEKATSSVSIQNTDLGSRMNRVKLIESRLANEESTYSSLLSETEDLDYIENATEIAAAQFVYEASLKSSSNILQVSLVDFI